MRKMARIAASTCVALGAAAGTGGAGLAVAAEDYAVGTGQNQIARVSFAAHGGPSPLEPARGHFMAKGSLVDLGSIEAGPFHFLGPVTCLTVVGNRAGLYYPLEKSDPPEFEGQGVFIFLEDNGEPGTGAPDRVGFVGPVPAPSDPVVCPPGPTPLEFRHGNVTVRDRP